MTEIIEKLSDVSANYAVLLVDLWGCVHNGVTAYPAAVAALQAYRKAGGTVVLLTNSPRPRANLLSQLHHFGVPDDAWDTIATSGDSARAGTFTGMVGKRVWHIGHPRDLKFFEPLQVISDPVEIELVEMEEAEGIVCTGPFDPLADPEDMRGPFLYTKAKGLEMICANPDIVVDRGAEREWCAGALAKLYDEMGGTAHYFGKPHPPIYDLAYRRLAEIGVEVDKAEILAIGDGVHTDILGATGEGIDSLFITGGLAAERTSTKDQPDPQLLKTYLEENSSSPRFSIGFLR